ncbi:competence CoiA-like predicted nuclease [Deinococcus metalli]|uniref:Competence CoiA-like predicted nuclease n=1 Tax=Deinococcus metalli TaxID=1141878 RepID=A0A7W8NQ31_9DEIO|nr:competence protein CoiA family protein [Deinococcus metalli]MBB5378589.1 competence CoiA-like predicted nuclease [Deinococcus metalli]
MTTTPTGESEPRDMVALRRTFTADDIRTQEWHCKFCDVAMIPVLGAVREWHFRHLRDASECPAHRELETESPRHRLLKQTAAEALQIHYGARVASLEYEARVKDAGRIADALLTMTDATRLAVEAQVSPISFENVQRRTSSYTDADVDVIWVFIAEEGTRLRPGSSWDNARTWLIDEGYMVVIATLDTEVTPLPLAR